jgi:hypothetical protein
MVAIAHCRRFLAHPHAGVRFLRSTQFAFAIGCMIGLLGCTDRDGYSYGSVLLSSIEIASRKDVHWVKAKMQNPMVNDAQQVVGYLFLFASPTETTEGKIESIFIRQTDSTKEVRRHGDICYVFINESKEILGIEWMAE